MNSVLPLLAAFGVLGVFVRYGLAPLNAAGPWPWGTFLANLLGCFLMLLVFTIKGDRLPPRWALVLAVGLLGGMTTFSSYLLELYQMASQGKWGLFGAYLIGTHLAAFAVGFGGVVLGRAMTVAPE